MAAKKGFIQFLHTVKQLALREGEDKIDNNVDWRKDRELEIEKGFINFLNEIEFSTMDELRNLIAAGADINYKQYPYKCILKLNIYYLI